MAEGTPRSLPLYTLGAIIPYSHLPVPSGWGPESGPGRSGIAPIGAIHVVSKTCARETVAIACRAMAHPLLIEAAG